MGDMEPETGVELSAAYSSPSTSHQFAYPQGPVSKEPPAEERTMYLSNLRKSLLEMQKDVNAFLTQKMEEDKNASARVNGNGVSAKIDENKEEENYGEEADDEC